MSFDRARAGCLRIAGTLALFVFVGCPNPPAADAGTDLMDAGTDLMDAGADDDAGSDAGADAGVVDGGLNWQGFCPEACFDFSLDPDVPLAIDGAFSSSSDMWARPHDEEELCPAATTLDTAQYGGVPYVAFAFCNTDSVPHTFDFEMLGQQGPAGETPLTDSYLILYDGACVPSDQRQCVVVNDDLGPLTGDSEVLGVTVPAGGSVTMVGTTFQFDAADGTGAGGYVLVVTNAD